MKTGNKRRTITLILVVAFIAILAGAFYFLNQKFHFLADTTATNYYVATNGNDSWSGTLANPNQTKTDGPFATLDRARDRIRELKSSGPITLPIVVNLRQGSYYLSTPFSLDERDSGTENAPITYTSYPGEKATVTSGKVLQTDWKSYKDGIYVTDVDPTIEIFNSLFVDQKRVTRARTPNEGSYFQTRYDEQLIGTNGKTMFAYNPGDVDPSWSNVSDIQVVSLQRWLAPRNYVSTIDESKVEVSGENPASWGNVQNPFIGYYSDYDKQNRYYLDNVFEKLDTPGEWYFNKVEHKLYYLPKDSAEINNSVFIVPTSQELVKIASSKANDAKLNLSSGFSISGWVKTGASKNQMYYMANAGSSNGFRFGLSGGKIQFLVGDGVGNSGADTYKESTCSDQTYNDNQWHMITGVFDLANKSVTCYADGEKTASVELAANYQGLSNTLPIIGKPTAGTLFEGSLDEVILAEKVLTQGEITTLHTANTLSSPTIHLSFDENYNQTPGLILDASGNYVSKIFNYSNLQLSAGKFGNGASFPGTAVDSQPYFTFLSTSESPTMRPSHIVFKDLNFAYTDWSVQPEGYYSRHGGSFTISEASINLASTSNISFIGNSFSGLGAFAINSNYSNKLLIKKNNFFDLGGGAIKIVNDSPVFNDAADGNQISDNIVNDTSRVFRDAIGIITMHSANNKITSNTIFNLPYDGIAVGYDWTSNQSASKNNLVSGNIIHDVMQLLNDGGAIYFVGNQITGKIENNIIYNVLKTAEHKSNFGINGIYLDGGSTGMQIENNLLVNLTGHAFHIGGVSEQNVVNNIIYNPNGEYPPLRAPNVAADVSSGAKFLRNVVFIKRGATEFYNLKNTNYSATGGWPQESDYNLIDNGTDGLSQLSVLREKNLDVHSLVSSAQFVNSSELDFCLQSSSLALKELGFISFSNCKIPEEKEYSLVGPDIRNTPIIIYDPIPLIGSINITEGQIIATNPFIISLSVKTPADTLKISKVEFYIDNILISTSTLPDVSGTYQAVWDTSKYHSVVKVIVCKTDGTTEEVTRNTTVQLPQNYQSLIVTVLPQTGGETFMQNVITSYKLFFQRLVE